MSAANHTTGERGNLIIVLAFALTGVFAVAGLAIDTTLYLLKRQEIQVLAESVASAAALNLPQHDMTISAAERWYDLLRIQGGHEIAPDRTAVPAALQVKLIDNSVTASNEVAYKVSAVVVRVTQTYVPNIFKVPGLSYDPITVVGEATAQLRPTDVVLVVENSASLYQRLPTNDPNVNPLIDVFDRDKAMIYGGQCFGDPAYYFKRGAVILYDILSQIETFRVGVVFTDTRTGGSHVLANLGETTIDPSQLEYDDDQPDYHSTRCAALTSSFNVPNNLNAKGSTWLPRTDLTSLLKSATELEFAADTKLLVREALWIQPEGYTTGKGVIHPRYYYSDPTEALFLAASILYNSRRPDEKPVTQRYVLWLTDGPGAQTSTIDATHNVRMESLCPQVLSAEAFSQVKLGLLYFGHTKNLRYHGWESDDTFSDADSIRHYCLKQGHNSSGIFFTDTSPRTNLEKKDYGYKTLPLVAHAMKEVELVN